MAQANPYKQYQQQSILTMTPGELVVRLYDECLKCLNAALHYFDEKQPDEAETRIKKAQRIVHYLDVSLDRNVEMAGNLHMLYDYFIRSMVQATAGKRKEKIEELIPMFQSLRDSFVEAEKAMHKR